VQTIEIQSPSPEFRFVLNEDDPFPGETEPEWLFRLDVPDSEDSTYHLIQQIVLVRQNGIDHADHLGR
jgi:hypothetical protein